MNVLPPYLKVLSGTEVYKNAKTHNLYHRSLCFIFDQTTMGQEQKSLGDSLSPRFSSEGRGASVHRLLRSTMAAERFSNLNRRRHRLLTATKREQTIQYNITITDKEILVYIYIIIIIIIIIIRN